jgi:hypothetical protein
LGKQQTVNPSSDMEIKELLVGTLVTVFVFGAYFLGAFQEERAPVAWREFFAGVRQSLTWKGFVWATALPTCWLLLFYTFVAHVRLSLGRWPEFAQHLDGWAFAFYDQATRQAAWALISSLSTMASADFSAFTPPIDVPPARCPEFHRWDRNHSKDTARFASSRRRSQLRFSSRWRRDSGPCLTTIRFVGSATVAITSPPLSGMGERPGRCSHPASAAEGAVGPVSKL